jgi:hypothetical protein
MPVNYTLHVQINNQTDVNFTNGEVEWSHSDSNIGGVVAFATIPPRGTVQKDTPSNGCVNNARAQANYREPNGTIKTLYLTNYPQAPDGQCYTKLGWTIGYGANQEPQANADEETQQKSVDELKAP